VDKTPWLESWNVGAPGGSSAGGEDAGNMSAETKQMLTNCEVIAVDQDPEERKVIVCGKTGDMAKGTTGRTRQFPESQNVGRNSG